MNDKLKNKIAILLINTKEMSVNEAVSGFCLNVSQRADEMEKIKKYYNKL